MSATHKIQQQGPEAKYDTLRYHSTYQSYAYKSQPKNFRILISSENQIENTYIPIRKYSGGANAKLVL